MSKMTVKKSGLSRSNFERLSLASLQPHFQGETSWITRSGTRPKLDCSCTSQPLFLPSLRYWYCYRSWVLTERPAPPAIPEVLCT